MTTTTATEPNRQPPESRREALDRYHLGIASAVRVRANCKGSRVGAVIALSDRVVATGYNGTAVAMPNCEDGGCERCDNRGQVYSSGEGYDRCLCVHAEQNAILSAARFGIPVDGSVLYSTVEPCPTCTKEALQAGILRIVYDAEWQHKLNEVEERQYRALQRAFQSCRQLATYPDGDLDLPRANGNASGQHRNGN